MTPTTQPLVLYHADCWDGFCAAWLLRTYAFGDAAEYVPVLYGQVAPDVTGRNVMVVDFSYPRPAMERMYKEAVSLVVLDHHKTAQADLDGLDYCTFDMTRSGAQMVWDWLVEQRKLNHDRIWGRHWLVDYTADRDLWTWALPYSKEINACLRSYSLDFVEWDRLAKGHPHDLIAPGQAILRAEQVMVDTHVRNAREIDFDGHRVLCVNATVLFSDIAGQLAEGRPFGVTWFRREDGRYQYSLRSREDGADVSAIAKAHGGGGHRNAAGFESDAPPD